MPQLAPKHVFNSIPRANDARGVGPAGSKHRSLSRRCVGLGRPDPHHYSWELSFHWRVSACVMTDAAAMFQEEADASSSEEFDGDNGIEIKAPPATESSSTSTWKSRRTRRCTADGVEQDGQLRGLGGAPTARAAA